LIAAESQLKELQTIYTDSNVRVRALQARIAELQHESEKLGGSVQEKPGATGNTMDSNHPSLQNLPLLGVTYADLYRRMQIQEAVYEALTQQFELAKVQEAKETPSVKVLDSQTMPERKSFPPRLLIMFLCTVACVILTAIFLLGGEEWGAIDSRDPGKVFAQEVFHSLGAIAPWAPPNGSPVQAWANRIWVRLTLGREGSVEAQHDSAKRRS
jgi:hypothetical protein